MRLVNFPPCPLFEGVRGESIPPFFANNLIVMSSRKTKLRGISFCLSDTSSRSHSLCVPVWLLLYWLDLAITTSGCFRRRRLLRLRNSILDFLSVPSGSAWEVHSPAKGQ